MDKDFIKIFEETQALMHGHFILSSGLHSDTYFQCAKVLQYPKYLSMFGEILSNHFSDQDIDKVISPAIGGIVLGAEVGRQLNKKTIFSERSDGKMKLRRGFNINENEKILLPKHSILNKFKQQISNQTSEIWPNFEQHRLVIIFLGCL